MQPAPLRPVPSRPPASIAPAEAVRFTTGELPGLDGPAAEALALVALVGRSRQQAGVEAGVSGEELADALARARKALRRKLHPLPGSGWCERAERLISDRIDGALDEPGPARLDAHLTNCSRCVEHERRLAQAQDALVGDFLGARSTGESGLDGTPAPWADEMPVRVSALQVVNTPPLAAALPAPAARPAPAAEASPVARPPAPLTPPVTEVEPSPVTPPPAAEVEPSPVTPPPAAEVEPSPVALPPAPLPPPPRPYTPAPWGERDAPAARPALAARAALEAESTWTMVGPLVVVLTLVVMVFVLAGVLATGA